MQQAIGHKSLHIPGVWSLILGWTFDTEIHVQFNFYSVQYAALIPFPESKIAFVLLLKQTEADSGEDTMPLKIGELWKPSPPTLSSPNNNIQRDSNALKIY